MGKKVLITGGIKSGKSRFALKMAREIENGERFFIATARAIDDEMQDKIEQHRKDRGSEFKTIEEPTRLGAVLNTMNPSVVILDCLTLWLSNLYFEASETEKFEEIEGFIRTLKGFKGNLIIVTNEVGLGIVPGDQTSRSYQAELGSINQKVAEICDEVYVLISGVPLQIK